MSKAEIINELPIPRYEIFHLRAEADGRIHVGGLLVMPPNSGDDAFRVDMVAEGLPVETLTGGFRREIQNTDAPKNSRKRFVDFFVKPERGKPVHVQFRLVEDTGNSSHCPLSYTNIAPLTEKTASSYFRQSGWLFRSAPPNGFSVRPASFLRHVAWELRYDIWLLTHHVGRRTKVCIPIRWLALFFRPLMLKRRTWLIMDRFLLADDNGQALFQYLVKHRTEFGIRPVFFLKRDSPDWNSVQGMGPVRSYTSARFRFASLFAEWIVSSHYHHPIVNPLSAQPNLYRGIAADLKYCYLDHGVINNDCSGMLNRSSTDLTLFTMVSEREKRYVEETPSFGYPSDKLVLTGRPRFDLLYDKREKVITFCPTWRHELCSGLNKKTGDLALAEGFERTPYFLHLKAALTSQRLHATAEQLGFCIQFIPHPVFQPYADLFAFDPRVRVIADKVCYRDIFAHSAICVSDYSSTVFTFAYLGKPVVYYQPDKPHYEESYFIYERDGFGPVTRTPDALVDILIDLMERDVKKMEEPYRSRAESFFAFHDRNNCRRVAEAILAASTS